MLDFDDLEEAEETGEATTEEQQEARAARQAEEQRLAAEEAARKAAEEEAERQRREAQEAEAERARAAAEAVAAQELRYWQVVHSVDAGGLVVQEAEDKLSPKVGRLAVGAVVLELQRSGTRLQYRWQEGGRDCAATGWVSIKGSGPWGKECLKLLGGFEQWQAVKQQASEQPSESAQGSVQEALIVIDWDDTLCPTTFIRQTCDLLQEPPGTQEQLDAQAQAALRLLRKASALGSVAVVTLAERAWVEASCREYLPALSGEIAALDVFYAGDQNMAQLRSGALLDMCTLQKKRAMEEALRTFSKRLGPKTAWRNFVSIGDSEAERNAAKDLGRESKVTGQVTWTKTVKLRDHPDLHQLTEQLRAVELLLPELLAYEGSRSVELNDGRGVAAAPLQMESN